MEVILVGLGSWAIGSKRNDRARLPWRRTWAGKAHRMVRRRGPNGVGEWHGLHTTTSLSRGAWAVGIGQGLMGYLMSFQAGLTGLSRTIER